VALLTGRGRDRRGQRGEGIVVQGIDVSLHHGQTLALEGLALRARHGTIGRPVVFVVHPHAQMGELALIGATVQQQRIHQ